MSYTLVDVAGGSLAQNLVEVYGECADPGAAVLLRHGNILYNYIFAIDYERSGFQGEKLENCPSNYPLFRHKMANKARQ